MTTAEREAYDSMLACLCGLKMMAAYEAKLGQTKWRDILPSLDATIAQAQGVIK
jgi:hypothetical protein